MRKKIIFILFVCVLSLVQQKLSYADARMYVWTYEYQTVPKGMSEIEFYETVKVPDTNDARIKSFEHWVEYEYGVTDRFDIAIYTMWKTKQKRAEYDTKYDGTKVRVRYRFGEKGQYFLDPLVYLEYKRTANLHDPHKLEVKLILANDIGKFNLAYNQILNQDLERHGVTESEYALGVGYKLNNHLTVGIESKGSYLTDKYYYGPTVSYRGKKFWFAAGFVTAMHKRADDLQARMIVGVPF